MARVYLRLILEGLSILMRLRLVHSPLTARVRAGVALIQCLIMLTVLVGIASLATDYGRVQLAKMELERCATAAARAAASRFLTDQSAARDLAVQYASLNRADGTAVVLDRNQDVEFGHWDAAMRRFTAYSGANLANADAVQVTARRSQSRGTAVPLAFGSLVGKSSCDVKAACVVSAASTAVNGFVGLDSIIVGANFYAAGYNSNSGAPGGSNVSSSANLASNGMIQLGNNADVYGNLVMGPVGSVVSGTHVYVSGSQSHQPNNLSYPATEPASVASSGAFNGNALTLSAGTYYYTSMTFGNGGQIVTTGPVTIYVSGNFTANNDFTFAPYQSKPSNLRIRMIGSGTMALKNDADGAAEIYAPGATVSVQNNLFFGGSIVAKVLSVKNNADLYRDTASGAGGGTTVITMVK
jgi:hypothetical protein